MLENIYTKAEELDMSIPMFVHPDITIREIAQLADMNPSEYFQRIDDIWTATCYPLAHQEICKYLDRPAEKLLDSNYNQQAFNFVFSATIGWAKATVIKLSELHSAGIFKVHQETGKVIPFVKH